MEAIKKDENFKFTAEIKISIEDEIQATIDIPAEIRLTSALLSYITGALKARGLELKHMNIAPQHEEELSKLSNVVLEKTETPG